MSTTPTFAPVTVTPPVEALAYTFLLPDDWHQLEVPADPPDFSNAMECMALGVATAKYAAFVFSVAARPGYGEGSASQWLAWLVQQQEHMAVERYFPVTMGGVRTAACDAVQQGEAGPMRVRTVLLEDGGNLFLVSAMAALPLWEAAMPTLERMIASFALVSPQGPKFPAGLEGFMPEEAAPATTDEATPAPATFAKYALAADASSLDPEHPTNKHFSESGAGLVPNVMEVDAAARSATVAAGAIAALVTIPLGWHAIDDGRRTLVFDAANRTQINFALLDPAGHSMDDVLAALERETKAQHPQAESMRLDLENGTMPGMAFRGLVEDETPLEQMFLYIPCPPRDGVPEGMRLQVRTTSVAGGMAEALNLSEIVIASLAFAQ